MKLFRELDEDIIAHTKIWSNVTANFTIKDDDMMTELRSRNFNVLLQESQLSDYFLVDALDLVHVNIWMYGNSPDI